jgi:PST family polysaccharide transporter
VLTQKTTIGVAWALSSRLSTRAIDVLVLLLLARSLTPADFGVIALAMAIVTIVEMLFEMPLTVALIRMPELKRAHLDTAFTLGLLRGGIVGIFLIVAAFPYASLYQDSRLTPLIAALAIGAAVRGLYSPGMTYDLRDLRFRNQFICALIGKLFAAIAALSALAFGGAYWALALNTIVAALATTALSYVFGPYRPRLSIEKFNDFVGLLGWFSASQVLAALNWQLDRLVLGYYLNRAALGRYVMAMDVSVLPIQTLIIPVMQPLTAAFATIALEPERLRAGFLKASRFTMMLSLPACIILCLQADHVVVILLEHRWAETAPLLSGLALSVLPVAYVQTFTSLATTLDKTKIVFQTTAIEFVLRLVLLPVGFFAFSVWGAIIARGIVALVMFVVCFAYVRQLVGLSFASQLKNLAPTGAAGLAMATVMALAANMAFLHAASAIVTVFALSAAGGIIYILVLLVFGLRLREVFPATK